MKRNLITGITALGMCIAFTNCSKDLTPMSQEEINAAKAQQIVDKYNNAFVDKFGQPAANQDWGFGNNSAASPALTRALGDYTSRGHLAPTGITFPEDCDASKFLEDVPEGVNIFPASGDASAASGPFYIDATTTRVNMYAGAGVIYVKGIVDLSSDNCFEIPQNTEIYLIKGSTLKIGTNDANKLKAIIYIESTATLETANRLKMDNTSKVYNHGTIKAGAFEVNNTSFLYNVGTLDATNGLVYVANNNSSIVNDGIIKAGDVEVAGSGNVQNNAEWYVSGITTVNSNSAAWVNNGYWKTQYYAYTAGSENVINNCFLEVTEDFDMNISSSNSAASFKIDTGGGVLTKNFYGGKNLSDPNSISGPYKIVMGHSAVFKVTGTATLEGGNPGWGFFGPADGDYAVFQAKNVVRNESLKNTHGAVTYSGNLYVSAETHFAQGNDGYAPHKFIYEDGDFSVDTNIFAEGFRPGKPGITIEETACCPGFEGEESFDEFDVRIIGEDLTPGDTDWDFNDVVFGVKFNDAGNGATCTLLAAGGTLPLRIAKKGNADLENADEWVEVHALFGVPTTTMVNTGGRSTTVDLRPTFDVTGISKSVNGQDIKIYVNKGTEEEPNWIELKAEKGNPAAKLAVKKGFRICTERQNINEIYKRFEDWVDNPLIRWY